MDNFVVFPNFPANSNYILDYEHMRNAFQLLHLLTKTTMYLTCLYTIGLHLNCCIIIYKLSNFGFATNFKFTSDHCTEVTVVFSQIYILCLTNLVVPFNSYIHFCYITTVGAKRIFVNFKPIYDEYILKP